MGVKPRSVSIHIEHLVLEGFAPGDRKGIAAAVERELKRIVAEQGVPRSLTRTGAVASMDAGAFRAPMSARPANIGGQVARALYAGWKL